MSIFRFPEEFTWGVATSAQQIEGAWDRDGRAESIWDRFASEAGNIEDGSRPCTNCRHYDLWRQDLDLMRWLGVGAYRFSTSWSRVMPGGGGRPNSAGLDFYDQLVDALLAAGIEPFLTLNHWDIPQRLQDRGGWPARDTCGAFGDYTAAVSRRLGDRIRHWTTHNEPWCVATLGFEEGSHAPGHHDPQEALRAAHHLLLSHGQASEIIRSQVPNAEVSIVLNVSPGRPASSTEADRDAVRQFDGFFHRWYLDPLFHGRYPPDAVRDRVRWGHLAGEDLPFVQAGDLDRIRAPLDCLGVNYYSGTLITAGPDGRPQAVPPAAREAIPAAREVTPAAREVTSAAREATLAAREATLAAHEATLAAREATLAAREVTEMGWEVYPQGLTEALLRLERDYDLPPLYITENGAAFVDPAPVRGRIADPRRVAYLRDHLVAAHHAMSQGVRLRGYFAWSLLDNFEWGHGFTKRFGLFGVDFATGERTPKDSAYWYRETVAARAVDDGTEP